MMGFKKFKSFILTIVFFLIFQVYPGKSFSEPLKDSEKLPPLSYKFEYTPTENASQSNIVIAFVKPSFKSEISVNLTPNLEIERLSHNPAAQSYEAIPAQVISNVREGIQECISQIQDILKVYSESLRKDLEKVILSKGFKISGSFDNLDDLTYRVKDEALLVFVPEIFLKAQFQDINRNWSYGDSRYLNKPSMWRNWYDYMLETIFKYEGNASIEVIIKVTLYEPLMKEKILVKQISIPLQSIAYNYNISIWIYHYTQYTPEINHERVVDGRFIKETDSRPHVLAKALESVYVQQLEEFSKYLDSKEIEQAKLDAEEIRKRIKK